MSLYQQLVKVLYVLDLNGTGIFIQRFYIVVFWWTIIGDFKPIGAWQCHVTGVRTWRIWAEIIYKCPKLMVLKFSLIMIIIIMIWVQNIFSCLYPFQMVQKLRISGNGETEMYQISQRFNALQVHKIGDYPLPHH